MSSGIAFARERASFLNLALDELFDLKDRLHRFVRTAGPTESRTASRGELEPA